jgi:ribonucleoside-diphosphate reductase alpha chain
VPSLLAAIGGVIERHMIEIGFLDPSATLSVGPQQSSCPRCGERRLVFQEGCATCLSCGFSKCS